MFDLVRSLKYFSMGLMISRSCRPEATSSLHPFFGHIFHGISIYWIGFHRKPWCFYKSFNGGSLRENFPNKSNPTSSTNPKKHPKTIHKTIGRPLVTLPQVSWLQLQRADRVAPTASPAASAPRVPRKARRELRRFECPEPVKLGAERTWGNMWN